MDGLASDARRRFMRRVLGTAALLAIPGLAGPALAADLPRLDPANPMALSLGYTHTAKDPDTSCATCAHFKGDSGAQWAGCNIFAGSLVSAGGWCSAYVRKS